MKKCAAIGAMVTWMCLVSSAPGVIATIEAVGAAWDHPSGGFPHYIEFTTATSPYGNQAQRQFRWGDPYTAAGKSWLGFTGVAAPSLAVGADTPFPIGQLVHVNRPLVVPSACQAVELALDVAFVDGPTAALILQLTINETIGRGTRPKTDDFITLDGTQGPALIWIAGTQYAFEVAGFGTRPGNITDAIRTPEDGQSTTTVWGILTIVPEPATCLLLGLGSLVLLRRRGFTLPSH